MRKHHLRYIRNFSQIALLVLPSYILIMLVISTVVCDNPDILFQNQASAEIVNPFSNDNATGGSNYSEVFEQFEGFVIIASAVETTSHNLHLFALPGQNAQIYRNFSIYVFSNQPCFYEVRIDDQILQQGHSNWKAVVKSSSPYTTMDVKVTLINDTNVSLPVFIFSGIKLLDSPWDAIDEGEGPPVAEEWIRFSQGEFTAWVIRGILIQVGFAFLGVVCGTSYASVHADLRGIQRVI